MNQHLYRSLGKKKNQKQKQKNLVNGISSQQACQPHASCLVEVYIRVSMYSGILFDGLGQWLTGYHDRKAVSLQEIVTSNPENRVEV